MKAALLSPQMWGPDVHSVYETGRFGAPGPRPATLVEAGALLRTLVRDAALSGCGFASFDAVTWGIGVSLQPPLVPPYMVAAPMVGGPKIPGAILLAIWLLRAIAHTPLMR